MPKKLNKRIENLSKKIDSGQSYPIQEAFKVLHEMASTKFDEAVDVAVNLGVDSKQSDQQVRGSVKLPHGLGKTVKVVVFAKGEKEQEATEAQADFVGSEDLVEKIKGGWLDFDKVISTPDMMSVVSKVAKILGPRGLMPNPKVGTVTQSIAQAVRDEKKGKLVFKLDKAGIIHTSIGRRSMALEQLQENYDAFMEALTKAKPASSKGVYIKKITLSLTMSPSVLVKVD